jgi:hypothetical protein
MTAEERTIANAALGAGPWDTHDQIAIAVADVLKLEPRRVEAVLQQLRIRMVLVCVSAANATSETLRFGTSGAWIGWRRSENLGCRRCAQFVATPCHNAAVCSITPILGSC